MPSTIAILADGQTVEFLPQPIGSGAMKDAYLTADRRSVVCFYRDQAAGADPRRRQRLEAILGRYNLTVPRSHGGAARDAGEATEARAWFCWPTGIVVAPCLGIVTPVYPEHFYFASGPDFLQGKVKHGLRFIGRKNRAILAQLVPDELGDWRNHVALCLQIAWAVARLHEAGLVHSDLSLANVLVDPSRGVCLVTDVDALVVEGLFPPDVLGTRGYIAPEVLATRRLPLDDPRRRVPDVFSDRHALAVLIYQYLLLRHPLEGRKVGPGDTAKEQEEREYGSHAVFCEHPTDASNWPAVTPSVPSTALGVALNSLMLRAFVEGLHQPDRRPTAGEWVEALNFTQRHLCPCPNTGAWHRWFVVEKQNGMRCPFCETGWAR